MLYEVKSLSVKDCKTLKFILTLFTTKNIKWSVKELLLKRGFFFLSSTPLAWQWVCDPLPSLLMKTTVSQPFTELLGKKTIHHSVQLNKGISVTPNQHFYFLLSPLFCEESGSKRDSDNCMERHIRIALKWTANNDLCMYMCGKENVLYMCMLCGHIHMHTLTHRTL